MPRQGIVKAINPNRGMVGILAEDGRYTIIELLSGWEISVGDKIKWKNGYGLGSEIYENTTKRSSQEVYVQNHDVHEKYLRVQLLF